MRRCWRPAPPGPRRCTVGQPTDGTMGFQPQVTPIGQEALWFHNALLMPLITAISIFVLALLLYVMVRFRRSANPVPSRTTHNTLLEVVWTLVPVLILVAIAVPSPAPRPSICAAQGRHHGQGDRQPMVLDLHLSRPWRLRARLQRPQRRRCEEARRAEAARGRRADGGSAGRDREGDRHRRRRHPQLGRPRFLDQDRRRARPAQRDLVQDRQARRLLRPVLRAVRRPPRLHADRGRGSSARAVRRLGRLEGRTMPDRAAQGTRFTAPRRSPTPGRATPAALPATETSPAPPGITPGTTAPPTSSQGATNTKRGN